MMPHVHPKRFCFFATVVCCILTMILMISKQETYMRGYWKKPEEVKESRNQKTSTELEFHQSVDRSVKIPWFFSGGSLRPKAASGEAKLFPEEADGDRIVEQLMYVPEGYNEQTTAEKVILAHPRLSSWNQPSGSKTFEECPVKRCTLTDDSSKYSEADAILFKDSLRKAPSEKKPGQIWIMYLLECPFHTSARESKNLINWTATYRRDSDIVAPYEKWVYYNEKVRQIEQSRDYSANKTKQVAWFVSNCGARNNRLQYARQLSEFISVDIYGACGEHRCSRSSPNACYDMLRKDYKFYLAFENSNCRDYMTEKFFVNGLGNDIIPIVMGARLEEYVKSAPQGSFIHVDQFASPKELAEYLKTLDQDRDLYNSFFKWKGTGEFINTHFWCRLCAMVHAPKREKVYGDFKEWWAGDGVCVDESWNEVKND